MDQPLNDIRVIDLGQIYQGGYCGLLLTYLGAEVLKVEPPWGDNVRTRSEDKKSVQYQFLNANRKSITLNLKTEVGKEALRDLVAGSDVVIENYKAGTMDDLGVGYENLSTVNPELVYAHGSGYGDTGPYSEYPAMDLTIQAMSGVMHTTGFPEDSPVKAGPAVCDFLGGAHLFAGVLGALYQRERTGEGQYIDVGMFDCMYPTLASAITTHLTEMDLPPRTGNHHSGYQIAPYNSYKVNDGHVVVLCITEQHWKRLTTLMGRPELTDDERFSSKTARADNMDRIDELIQEWLNDKRKEDVVDVLLEEGIPCAPVKTVEELLKDPHLEHRQMLNRLPNQRTGHRPVPVPGLPIKFSGSTAPEPEQAPALGEHTDEVMSEVAGYTQDEIDELQKNGS